MSASVGAVEMRQCLRHPLEVPIRCRVRTGTDEGIWRLLNISDGGAAFVSTRKYRRGQPAEMTFPVVENGSALRGVIAWCRPDPEAPGRFVSGFSVDNPRDPQGLRMVEQICHLVTYCVLERHLSGRVLTEDEAREWISRYTDSWSDGGAAGRGR